MAATNFTDVPEQITLLLGAMYMDGVVDGGKLLVISVTELTFAATLVP